MRAADPGSMNVRFFRTAIAASLLATIVTGQTQQPRAQRHAQPGAESRAEQKERAEKRQKAAATEEQATGQRKSEKGERTAEGKHQPGTDPQPEHGRDGDAHARQFVMQVLEGECEGVTPEERAKFHAMVREMMQRAHERREQRRDQREDRRDLREDGRDAREDVRDGKREGGRLDRAEDRRDVREDRRDTREDVRDQRTDKEKPKARAKKAQTDKG